MNYDLKIYKKLYIINDVFFKILYLINKRKLHNPFIIHKIMHPGRMLRHIYYSGLEFTAV